ncbi:hypothetical protein BKA62DRAFT_173852 [Auriculariales sp. MPI-PUGE-AT-0066]|nr:hypothetical protein BKA62DRAFT_173852 [Auriculariales sp. MPI-PUGE-AT-0066]
MSEALPTLSNLSTPSTARILWSAGDFALGAGAVIIQPSTSRVCILEDMPHKAGRYFLPRGRKDVGETLEQAVLREVFEESGFRATFLPALYPQLQPRTHGQRTLLKSTADCMTTEPFYIMQTALEHGPRASSDPDGWEYIVFWYLCQIPEDAQREANTGMANELGFVSRLLSFDEALEKMRDGGDPFQYKVLQRGIQIWVESQRMLAAAPDTHSTLYAPGSIYTVKPL